MNKNGATKTNALVLPWIEQTTRRQPSSPEPTSIQLKRTKSAPRYATTGTGDRSRYPNKTTKMQRTNPAVEEIEIVLEMYIQVPAQGPYEDNPNQGHRSQKQ